MAGYIKYIREVDEMSKRKDKNNMNKNSAMWNEIKYKVSPELFERLKWNIRQGFTIIGVTYGDFDSINIYMIGGYDKCFVFRQDRGCNQFKMDTVYINDIEFIMTFAKEFIIKGEIFDD
jgi:hypothetical protein